MKLKIKIMLGITLFICSFLLALLIVMTFGNSSIMIPVICIVLGIMYVSIIVLIIVQKRKIQKVKKEVNEK